ncbi:MAG: quinone-dependent dihydroorotate dehydrogenase, partial [Gammaproteobacteria bacterium]|nr:quinone-dependent dihydroorotate dehydrogenase [Gammaproteobacteria bacterium]
MYTALRPLLFTLPPEFAHKLALAVLRGYGALPASGRSPGSGIELQGLRFPNRIGLAAGLDKDATAMVGLAKLGFGFVEVGTVTPRPQLGNPKPRLFRLRGDAALINRMGFNSAGVVAVAENLRRVRDCGHVPVGGNSGK